MEGFKKIFSVAIMVLYTSLSYSQLTVHIDAPIGVAIHQYKTIQANDDFTYSTFPITYGALQLEFRYKKLGILLGAEMEGWSRFEWNMESCQCSNSYVDINRANRVRFGLVYYPEMGLNRWDIYGGFSFEKYNYYYGGTVGSGHPIQFPISENDYRVMAQLNGGGNSASFLVGGLHHFSPKFSLGLHVRYSAWLGDEPITDWDIRYYSSDFAYDMRLRDTGRIWYLSAGLRYRLNGKNL